MNYREPFPWKPLALLLAAVLGIALMRVAAQDVGVPETTPTATIRSTDLVSTIVAHRTELADQETEIAEIKATGTAIQATVTSQSWLISVQATTIAVLRPTQTPTPVPTPYH